MHVDLKLLESERWHEIIWYACANFQKFICDKKNDDDKKNSSVSVKVYVFTFCNWHDVAKPTSNVFIHLWNCKIHFTHILRLLWSALNIKSRQIIGQKSLFDVFYNLLFFRCVAVWLVMTTGGYRSPSSLFTTASLLSCCWWLSGSGSSRPWTRQRKPSPRQ